jgi:hypothetical protein
MAGQTKVRLEAHEAAAILRQVKGESSVGDMLHGGAKTVE